MLENMKIVQKGTSRNPIDQSIIWKKARMDHKGQIPDKHTKEVVDHIISILY